MIMVHGDCIQQLNHRGISDSTSWKYNAGHFDAEVFVNYKIQDLVFCSDNNFRSKCSALYYQLMLRVLLRNAFVVYP